MYDAERDLLAIAKFLVTSKHRQITQLVHSLSVAYRRVDLEDTRTLKENTLA